MADITNIDIINAIRGLYQNPNRVVDYQAIEELKAILNKLNTVLSANVQNWPTLMAVKAEDTDAALVQIKMELQEIENKLASVLNVSDTDAQAQLALVKGELQDIKTRLNQTFDVQLTGSNDSKDLINGVTVTAGSSYVSNNYNFYGSRIGIGIRLASAVKFRLDVYSKANDAANTAFGSSRVIDKTTAADRDFVSYQLMTRKVNFVFTNTDASDVTINLLTVTDFMS